MIIQPNLQAWTLLLGRVLIALIFVLSGIGKVFDFAGTAGYIASVGLPLASVGVVVAIVVELIGGLMLLAGYKTRLVALVVAAFTIVAAILFHNNLADQMQMIMFLKNLAIAGGLLFVAVFGPGRLSVDRG
ncbi:MAG: DoxX family protein [Deltaproteobacteria bacterium]